MNKQNPFRAVGSKERLVDRVVNEVERLIIEGELEPETRLPPERELAEQLGVSRTVVREAVHILVTKGLLETKPGVGTVVRQVTREQVVGPLDLYLRTQTAGEVSFTDLHQVRSILEVEIAGIAALQATKADIENLTQIATSMEAAQDDPTRLAARDADFHSALAKTTHNPLLIVLVDSIRDLLQEYVALVTPYLDPRQDNLRLHFNLLERVRARDAAGAREAMRENLDQMRRNSDLYSKLISQADDRKEAKDASLS
jgi:GntR family transcriptional repressor for pyruvate dehydrogenase complex